jgi:hypothetical protein
VIEARDHGAESGFAFGDRIGEGVERAAGHSGTRPTSPAGSDFSVARIMGVFDATIGVPMA